MYCSFIYIPSQPLVNAHKRTHVRMHCTPHCTYAHKHTAVAICEGYSCRGMTVFIQGQQADSVTFSSEKMINATIYIGMRKRKSGKRCCTRSSQRAKGRGSNTYIQGSILHTVSTRTEMMVIMNLISDDLSVKKKEKKKSPQFILTCLIESNIKRERKR